MDPEAAAHRLGCGNLWPAGHQSPAVRVGKQTFGHCPPWAPHLCYSPRWERSDFDFLRVHTLI